MSQKPIESNDSMGFFCFWLGAYSVAPYLGVLYSTAPGINPDKVEIVKNKMAKN